MKTAKLVMGILSIVLFLFIVFQSCTTGVVNSVEGNTGDVSGSAGLILAFAMLIAGIVGVAARNSRGGSLAAGILYALGALIGFVNQGTFGDLVIWSALSLIFGAVFILSFILRK